MFIRTTALDKILKLKSRARIVQGGTSAGKTIAILQILIDIAQSKPGKLISVVSEVAAHFAINDVAVAHRHGDIAIGECAFAVAVSADHREAAFDACSAIVNTVKEKLPIWKHQVFADGSDQWVNFA